MRFLESVVIPMPGALTSGQDAAVPSNSVVVVADVMPTPTQRYAQTTAAITTTTSTGGARWPTS
jgi:hypothetical protein